MDILCQFGPVRVLFQDFPKSPLWPFWCWSLDPYRVDGTGRDLLVSYRNAPVSDGGTVLWEEKSLLVCRSFIRLPDGRLLWQQQERETGNVQLQFTISADWREIVLTQDTTPTAGMGAFASLTFLIFYAFLQQKVLTFHGALIEAAGKGFLLCADSGVGKTTQAHLWREHKNALILNGDRATCFQKDGRWFGFGTPWCGTSGENLNRSVPISAVVLLQQGQENRVTPVSGAALLGQVVYPGWDAAATETMLALLDDFLSELPVLQLECTPDVSAVDALSQALEQL